MVFRITLAAAAVAVAATTGYPDESNSRDPHWSAQSVSYGIARPKRSATLRFMVAGTITQTHVREGQQVAKGAALVGLDDRLSLARLQLADISASRTGELKHAEVQLRFGQKKLARLTQLFGQNAVSELELDEQQAVVDRAQAIYETQREAKLLAEASRAFAEQQLRHMTVFAPFDGVVIELHQKLGASVGTDAHVVTVANLETLLVEMHTPIQFFGQLQRGDQVRLAAQAPIHSDVQATVHSVSPVVNSASGTFRCLLEIDNRDGTLPAGFAVTLIRESIPRAGATARL